MEWQPIETAPRTGNILGCGHWAGEINGVDEDNAQTIVVIAWSSSGDYPGFDWSVVGTDAYAAWLKPTHWMPLPELPEEEKASENT